MDGTLLRHAFAIVGNSSAGIREAPVYGVPAVDDPLRVAAASDNHATAIRMHRAFSWFARGEQAAEDLGVKHRGTLPGPSRGSENAAQSVRRPRDSR